MKYRDLKKGPKIPPILVEKQLRIDSKQRLVNPPRSLRLLTPVFEAKEGGTNEDFRKQK
jgi:hypothetical protein